MSVYKRITCRICILSIVLVFFITPLASASGRSGTFGTIQPSFGDGPNRNWSLLSYDSLSQLCLELNTDSSYLSIWQLLGVDKPLVASLFLCDDYFVISVTNNGESYFFCNDAGYPYYAEIDTTGEDMVSLLDSILVRLTLVESYVKSTYFELWEQGGTLDNIYALLGAWSSYLVNIQTAVQNIDNETSSIITSLATLNSNIVALSDALAGDGSSGGSTVDLSEIVTKQQAIITALGTISSNLIYDGRSIGAYLYNLSTNLTSVLNLMKQDGAFTTDISGISKTLDTANSRLNGIYSSLRFNNKTAAAYLSELNDNLQAVLTLLQNEKFGVTDVSELNDNLQAVLTLLQNEKFGVTDVSGIVSDLGDIKKILNDQLDLYSDNQDSIAELFELIFDNQDSTAELLELISDMLSPDVEGGVIEHLNSIEVKLSLLHEELYDVLTTGNFAYYIYEMYLDVDGIITDLSRHDLQGTLAYDISKMKLSLTNLDNKALAITNSLDDIKELLSEQAAGTEVTVDFDPVVNILTDINARLSELSVDSDVTIDLGTVETQLESIDGRLKTQLGSLTQIHAKIENYQSFLKNIQNKTIDIAKFLSDSNIPENISEIVTLLENMDSSSGNNVFNGDISFDTTSLESKLQELIDLVEDLDDATVENIQNITIDINNDAYEIFYISDAKGRKQSLGDFSGEVLTIGGRLLNFFFKVAFDAALDTVDSSLDKLDDFYISDSVVLEGSTLWE